MGKLAARRTRLSATGRIDQIFVPTDEERRHALAAALREKIEGEVRFDAGSRALYATDASNYRQVPLGVVVPRHIDDVIETVRLARAHGAPLVMRGGGTSLAGEGCNVAVLVDFSKYMHGIVSLDPDRRLAVVEPGCVLDALRLAAEKHKLTFGPDPATHDHNTLGGMIGNNSCGVHSIMSGRTSDNVRSLDILTYDGLRLEVGPTGEDELKAILAGGGRRAEIYRALDNFRFRYADLIRARYPDIPRRVSGYENLEQLLPEHGFNVARALVGTEATCVTVLRATLELMESPQCRVLGIVAFDDVFKAADAVPQALTFGPIGLEGMDDLLIQFMRRMNLHVEDIDLLPPGKGWLVAEFGADTRTAASAKAQMLVDSFKSKGHDARVVARPGEQQKIWDVREAGLAATAHVPGMAETWPGWEDSAVPREQLGAYLRELKALFRRYGYEASVYGHFGDGLIHCSIPFHLRTENGVTAWRRFLDEAADLVVRHGGSLSGEHGDGQARGALLEKMYGPELVQAFREFKAIWDPEGGMNPGKVVDPYPIESNLRVGPTYQPPEVEHHFAYPRDDGSFTRATRRCVGVGSCRRRDSDKSVMCPSYMATGEEKHSTRGRARLLFEMLHGGALDNGWRSDAVEEALDLCLACKACKKDCPVGVDMATYKAEFRAHHYRHRLRPRAAYSMGLIHRWSWIAGEVPFLANVALRWPGVSALSKWLGGIAPERTMPRYAQPFVHWHRRHGGKKGARGRVMLWPDTFNNYFRPQTAIAATKVLEALGYEVVVPARRLCCGRPLYDWGMIEAAKRLWRKNLATLAPEIERGTPIVGLEPACVSAFRDELPGLFPSHERAQRLSQQTVLLSEFLQDEDLSAFHQSGAALVQLHCHHHAVLKPEAEKKVLEHVGVEHEVLSAGCCGMAGSFGFEAAKYGISMKAAERALLPRLRQAASDTAVLANGFSCREQIEQALHRPTLHLADLLARALPGEK